METRFAVRKEADKQKASIMNAFESMKKKGKIDNQSLQRYLLLLSLMVFIGWD